MSGKGCPWLLVLFDYILKEKTKGYRFPFNLVEKPKTRLRRIVLRRAIVTELILLHERYHDASFDYFFKLSGRDSLWSRSS
ncbi:hypothetical protein Oant_4679 (plasmid) [Brucella anthropi ATCC 49188]|uniref:Uncharacterized protein n=1 Tax=Brucella anthropi (strain ATCC 49188 / DSM 6882 / CCUG 24695 / JCM 21032 / LMG 3331 / NBRC 15819 / NCTC 12168 / Alc 37) TaxID=439375 RepID=A6X895_BRUA4|nr:hypothetical protein Oant_4679 [Brucella anthropi ATCC 49188]